MRSTKYHRVLSARGSFLWILFSTAGGCGPRCDRPWYADRDGDGFGDRADLVTACERPEAYVADASDCDDGASDVHPGAVERCNGVDDDCDNVVDGVEGVWYRDLDEDGIGDTDRTVDACGAPDGYVATPGDCDDGDPTVYPGATVELCDGKDQDCDGIVDEQAPPTGLYFPDEDFDSWGDMFRGREYCQPPAGWIARGGDCDDGNYSISPDRIEVCNGWDDDCDGAPDEWDPQGVAGTTTVSRDADYDGYGEITAFTVDVCYVPLGYSTVMTDCDDDDPQVHPAAIEVCGGVDEDCDGLLDDADPTVDPASQIVGWVDGDGDGYGADGEEIEGCVYGAGVVGNDDDCDDSDGSVGPDWWLADLDGDGGGAGTPVEGEGCTPPVAGLVNVAAPVDCDDADPAVREGLPDPCGDGFDQDCSGVDPVCGTPLAGILDVESVSRGVVTGTSAVDAYRVVAAGRDLDGDGFGDAVMASPDTDADLLVFFGPGPELAGPWAPDVRVPSLDAGFGAALTLIDDVDGDGVAELAVGSPDDGGGKVHLLSPLDAVPHTTMSGFAGSRFGAALAHAGDVDGAAPSELVVGAPDDSEVYVLTAGETVFDALLRLQGVATSLGQAVACCADLDADGTGELVVGAPLDDLGGNNAGAVYAVPLDEVGLYAPGVVARAAWWGASGAPLGGVLAAGGDFDGDGRIDVAAGAPQAEGGAGVAYVLTQPDTDAAELTASYVVRGADPNLALPASLSLTDLDGDGFADLVFGAPDADLGGVGSGAVYVFYGPAAGDVDTDDADAVMFGPPGSHTGRDLAVGPIDSDPTPELWIAQPDVPGGGAWLIPGP